MPILQWIKSAEWIIKIAVATATVVVAVFSILIERELIAQEKRRAAVTRSIALYRVVVESEAFKDLLEIRYIITHYLWKKYGRNITPEQTKIGSVEVYREEILYERRNRIHQSVDALLHSIKTIYDCGDYKEKYGKNKIEEVEDFCDRKTISVLFGPVLANTFFAIRPVLYCDEFIIASFPIESYISAFESLVIDNLRETHGESKVFRTKKEAAESASEDPFFVRLTDRKRCAYYDPPPEPGDSPDGNG